MSALAMLDRLARQREAFPGALLLSGPSDDRLEAEARRLAALLLCPGADPDGTCDSCRRAGAGNHPDLFVVEPDGVQIKVERIRQALAFAAGRPYESSRRVVLLLHGEELGVEGANALLKSLEEPGAHLHWILTTSRPEALLPTILSRCASAIVPALSRAERKALWTGRGIGEDDAADLALFAGETETDPIPLLSEFRELRARILVALESGITDGPAPLLLLAEDIGRPDAPGGSLLAELLADAAVAAASSPDRIRHRAVAGPIGELGRRRSIDALRRAALAAADAPPDSRRGNRRLHFEALLLDLMLAR